MSVRGTGSRRFGGSLVALAALVAWGLLSSCASSQSEGGSNTNWLSCHADQDCPSGQACVAARCARLDGGSSATGKGLEGGFDGLLHLPDARLDARPTCAGEAFMAEAMPVDAYLMVDQSSSMGDSIPDGGESWWSAFSRAIAAFGDSPRASGIGVGIQYFPLGGAAPASCSAPYATPDVDIGLLPKNANAITASVGAHTPAGFRPTGPALAGAIAYMKTWAASHPGRAPVVVLVTDGFPTECAPQQITDIASIARTAFETEPRVRTFVVALNLSAEASNLDAIAQAGGSAKARLISSGDLGAQLTETMVSLASTSLQCVFDLPKPADPGQSLDLSLIAVRFTPNFSTVSEEVPKVNAVTDCALSGGGFYFDTSASPPRLALCSGTCGRVAAGTLQIVSCSSPPGQTGP